VGKKRKKTCHLKERICEGNRGGRNPQKGGKLATEFWRPLYGGGKSFSVTRWSKRRRFRPAIALHTKSFGVA